MAGRLAGAALALLAAANGGTSIQVAAATAAVLEIETIVLTGETAPLSLGKFVAFERAAIGGGGHVVFLGVVDLPDTGEAGSYRVNPDGTSERLALPLQNPENTPGRSVRSVELPVVFDDGNAAAFGEVGGVSAARDEAVLATHGTELYLRDLFALAYTGSPAVALAPALHGEQSIGIYPLVASGGGRVAWVGTITGDGVDASNNYVLWLSDAAGYPTFHAPVDMVRTDRLLLQGRNGSRWEQIDYPLLTEDDLLLFHARLKAGEGGVTFDDNGSIWQVTPPIQLSERLRKGDPAPGVAGGQFGELTGLRLVTNRFADLAFGNHLRENPAAGIDDDNDAGIWGPDDGGALMLLAREGDPAPGIPGAILGGFDAPLPSFRLYDVQIDDERGAVFLAFLELGAGGVHTANRSGIWGRTPGGDVALWVREGDPVPDAPGSVFRGGFHEFSFQSGALVFLDREGASSTEDLGLYHRSADAELTTVARVGDVWEIAQGDLRTIADLRFVGGSRPSGRPSGFDGQGRIVLTADFEDGSSGVFAVTVPEANAAASALAALAAAALLARRAARGA
jgi:hypothetical protein